MYKCVEQPIAPVVKEFAINSLFYDEDGIYIAHDEFTNLFWILREIETAFKELRYQFEELFNRRVFDDLDLDSKFDDITSFQTAIKNALDNGFKVYHFDNGLEFAEWLVKILKGECNVRNKKRFH